MMKHTVLKRSIAVILLLCVVCLFCACGKPIDYAITNDSIALLPERFGTYVNPDDPDDTYRSVIIEGREYLPYGVPHAALTGEMIGECIAFDLSDNNDRYYRVTDTDDFIANYYANGMMEQFSFLRARDTIDQAVEVPDFIDSLGYKIWQ